VKRALLVLAACGHPAPPPPAPPAPTVAPIDEPDLGDPPRMIASGAPVHITVPPQQVGMRFVREIDDVDDGDWTTGDGVRGRESVHRHYVVESTILEAKGSDILKLAITVRSAKEIHDREDKRTVAAPLHGNYVGRAVDNDFVVDHGDGSSLDQGEEAGLGELYHGQLPRFEELARSAPEHALRVGETGVLEDFIYHNANGEQVAAPVHVTLLAATDRAATYELDIHFTEPTFEIRARIVASVKIADGTLLELHGYARRTDDSDHERSTERRTVAITYEVLPSRS